LALVSRRTPVEQVESPIAFGEVTVVWEFAVIVRNLFASTGARSVSCALARPALRPAQRRQA
jgi:hypothetical protein